MIHFTLCITCIFSVNADSRGGGGRVVDRRASSSLKADGAGRSSSYLNRPVSTISSTGGRKSKEGSTKPKGKKKK